MAVRPARSRSLPHAVLVMPWSPPATRPRGTDVTLSMAKRAGATIIEIDGSHLIMVSQPDAVTDVVVKAAQGARA